MPNSLIEISPENWSKLRDLYYSRKNFASSHNTIQIFMNWFKQNPDVDVKIYTLDTEWENDGTYLAFTSDHIICNTLNHDLTRLTDLLRNFDKGTVYAIGGFEAHVLPAVEAYIAARNEAFEIVPTIWLHAERELVEGYDVELPSELKFVTLNSTYTELINTHWPYTWPTSTRYVDNMIRYNDSVGIVDDLGNLIGWCLINPIGTLALLHILDEYRRRGLASILVRYIAKKMITKDLEVVSAVAHSVSQTLFEKLNFKGDEKVYWAFKKLEK